MQIRYSPLVILLWWILSVPLPGQYSTAEFLTRIQPPVMTGEAKVPDGNRTLQLYYPYMLVGNQWFGIQIVDISNPLQPSVVSEVRIKGSARNGAMVNGHLYISDVNGALHIFDVSDLKNPRFVKRIRQQGEVQWVEADSFYIYLALGKDGVAIFEISEPDNPVLISSFKTRNYAWKVRKQGDLLFIADNRGGVLIYSLENPAEPRLVSTFATTNMVRSVFVDGPFMYLADGPGGLAIVDITRPDVPNFVSRIGEGGFSFGVYKLGQYVFLADEKKGLMIINAEDPAHPVLESSVVSESPAYDVVKTNIYLFLCTDRALEVYRHDNPPKLARVNDQVVKEDEVLTLTLSASDPDNDPIVFSMINLPEGAGFDSLRGILTWRPTYDQAGVYSDIVCKVKEKTATGLFDSDTITITVENVNRPPSLPAIAEITVNENDSVRIVVPEGSDPDREDQGKLRYLAENLPEGSSFDGKSRVFRWTPNFDQSGVYLVDFLVKDLGDLVSRQTLRLTVLHVDRPPVIEPIPLVQGKENEEIRIVLQGHDPDREDQNRIRFELSLLPTGATFLAEQKTFIWTPSYEQSGEYEMTARIISGDKSDSTRVRIEVQHVNRPPVLQPIAAVTVKETDTLRFSINGEDPDREDIGKLTFSATDVPEGAIFDKERREFFWVPTFEQSGTYEVQFEVSDPAGLKDVKTCTITVEHVNRPPVLAEIPDHTVKENEELRIQLQGSDPDREDTGKLQYSSPDLPAGATLDASTGLFRWIPDFDQSGEYTVTFMVSDGFLTDTKTAHITVIHVNRPPTLADPGTFTVNENELLTFTVSGSDPDREDEGKLTFSATQLPEGAVFDSIRREFRWTPHYEQSGSYEVRFEVSDPDGLKDQKIAVIQVNHVNRPPVLAEIASVEIKENMPIEVHFQGSDPDREDQIKLRYSVNPLPKGATLNPETGLFLWTPDFDQSGEYDLLVTLTDGALSVSQPFHITVEHVNRPPYIEDIPLEMANENESWSYTVRYGDPDREDQGRLTLTAANLPEGAKFQQLDGKIIWTPSFEQAGEYTVQVSVKDPAGFSDQKTFTIRVNNVNRDPKIEVLSEKVVKENETVTIPIQVSDPDQEDANLLKVSVKNLPSGAIFNESGHLIQWTPAFDQAGTYQIQVEVTDGKSVVSREITINVENVNRPPRIDGEFSRTIRVNESLQMQFTAQDPDPDDKIVFSISDLPSGAQFDGETGILTWTPSENQVGTYKLKVTAMDQSGAESSMEITIEVQSAQE